MESVRHAIQWTPFLHKYQISFQGKRALHFQQGRKISCRVVRGGSPNLPLWSIKRFNYILLRCVFIPFCVVTTKISTHSFYASILWGSGHRPVRIAFIYFVARGSDSFDTPIPHARSITFVHASLQDAVKWPIVLFVVVCKVGLQRKEKSHWKLFEPHAVPWTNGCSHFCEHQLRKIFRSCWQSSSSSFSEILRSHLVLDYSL